MPLVDLWEIYDNSSLPNLCRIAHGGTSQPIEVLDPATWNALMEQSSHEE
jgi:hypothetical protein